MLVEFPSPIDDGVKETLEELEQQVAEIRKRCREFGHRVIKKSVPDTGGEFPSWGGAQCYVCHEHLGWYCPESSDGLCEYENWHGYTSVCKHCHQPRERK